MRYGLFRSKAFNGVSDGGADRLDADRDYCDGEGGDTGDEEDPPADAGAIGKGLEPFVHSPPRDREGDDRGDPDQNCEVFAKQADDTADAGPEDFADADLLRALFCSIGDEAEETQTGDQNGEYCKRDKELPCLFLGLV